MRSIGDIDINKEMVYINSYLNFKYPSFMNGILKVDNDNDNKNSKRIFITPINKEGYADIHMPESLYNDYKKIYNTF